MIKIFQGPNADEVCQQANDFMTEIGQDCPVREAIYGGEFIFIVFYNGVNKGNIPGTTINIADIPPKPKSDNKPKSDKIGALWAGKDGSHGGSVEIDGKTTKINMDKEHWDSLETVDTKAGDKMKLVEIEGIKSRIIVNKFKNTDKHPDYVIMRAD